MATITIPTAYLEDARVALFHAIHEDGERLRAGDSGDRVSDALMLRRDIRLLDQLLDATTDTTLEADADRISSPIVDMLETMIRQLAGRLDRECVYAPLPLGEMLPLVEQMQWVMRAAARLCPDLVA